ncbi:MAG: hypothetical protein AAB152_12550 [Candidatus Coatesbacteria bacterium]
MSASLAASASRATRTLPAVLCLMLAACPGGAAAEPAAPDGAPSELRAPAGPEALVPPALPTERRPVRPGETSLWRVRFGLGASTMRLGGLEHFADPSVNHFAGESANFYGIKPGPTERRNINFSLVEAVEASFQVDPLVSVAMKVASLRSQRGTLRTIAQGTGTRLEDSWDFSTEMVLVMAGAGFNMPLDERLRLNITLFVGAGFGTVNIDHRWRIDLPAGADARAGAAEGTGTAFIPEFTMELERDLTESLAVGAGLGYRFGGIETFESRYGSTLNPESNTHPQFEAGWPIRNTSRTLLTADYGGLILILFFTARG